MHHFACQLRSIDVMWIKKGQQSIVDTAIDTFLQKYHRYRYIKSIVDNIDIDIDIRYYQPCPLLCLTSKCTRFLNASSSNALHVVDDSLPYKSTYLLRCMCSTGEDDVLRPLRSWLSHVLRWTENYPRRSLGMS